MRRAVLAVLFFAAACGDNTPGTITIVPAEPFRAVLTELVAHTPGESLAIGASGDADGFEIDVVQDPAVPAEGYSIETTANGYVVHAPDILGAQYGTTAALEGMGFRFRHPQDPYIPQAPKLRTLDTAVHQPQTRVRGLQIHTLHPIEGYFAFWEPSQHSTEEAHAIIDWVIKNRGNYLQWFALDNIQRNPADFAAWKPFTRELIDYAHARGIRVGLGFELFGQANLQLAFDLVDDVTGTIPIEAQVADRLPMITDGLPFDQYDLSFGEFFNANSQQFVDTVNTVYDQLHVLAPQAEMHALIHVGAAQVVHYMNEDLIYYFLVKYANPAIISDVHTVMFYDLFETASGAYQADDFSTHRNYLEDQMCAGRKPAYHPESAYWVAFDDSVPLFLPIYVKNRWYDLQQIRDRITLAKHCDPLDNHLLFSTGWEWDYWLNDTATMRATYELPETPEELVAQQFGDDLAPAAEAVDDLMQIQKTYLHVAGLMAYMSGRDDVIDAGRQLHIISQPDRVTFQDLVDGADRTALRTNVLQPLGMMVNELVAAKAKIDAADLGESRWSSELRAGFAIDLARAAFVKALYESTVAHLDGDAAGAKAGVAEAKKQLVRAGDVVTERHRDLHDPNGRRLVDLSTNQTFYQFSYLYQADQLCYWKRELLQVEHIEGTSTERIPDCAIE